MLLIVLEYLDVVRTEPAVTKLECWSMTSFSPFATPRLAWKPQVFSPVTRVTNSWSETHINSTI